MQTRLQSMDNKLNTDFNINELVAFIEKNVPNFSNSPIVEKSTEGNIEFEFYDIKSPSNFEHAFMHLRVYKDRQIFFLSRDQSELIKVFSHFTAATMKDSDIMSVIDIINEAGVKYGVYNKDKNAAHEKKIKKILKNRKELSPEIFFKTVYDIVGICGKGAWSKHGPTYIKRNYSILDDCSLQEWYTINYPLTGNNKIIVKMINDSNHLKIAFKFAESDDFVTVTDLEVFKQIVDDKFFSIYLPMIKKHLGNDRNTFNKDDITLLRMMKI